MKPLKTSLGFWLTGLAVALLPALAAAQDFPSKPIKLIVPFLAGGPNDIIARAVGQKMADILKQPVLIDNRGGQGGVIGTDMVAKAEPDGYTIAVTSAGALAISPSMQKIAYDTLKDLAPVTLVAKVPEMLVVATSVPANNMKELVALAKSQPGKLNFASSGPGSLPHLAGELFKLTAKIDIVHVPYRGAGQAVNDLIAGHVKSCFLGPTALIAHHKAGTIKIIGQTSAKRSPTLQDIPTLEQSGYNGLVLEAWYAAFAPAGTPKEIVDLLNSEFNKALKDPRLVDAFTKGSMEPIGGTPQDLGKLAQADSAKYARLVKELNIKVQ